MSFADLGLSAPILRAIEEQGYTTPSPIQLKAIPEVMAGKDVMAAAQTGTGKTAGFTLPILERLSGGSRASSNQARVLILTPTRELAAQIGENVELYSRHLPLRSAVVFGGVRINSQMLKLRKGADVLVATPGRLLDLYQQNAIRFRQLETLVLDEADRMLDMGFIHDIKKILALLPAKRQNLLFSATFSDDIRKLAKGLVVNPVEISVTPRNSTAETVKQWIHPVDKNRKPALLAELCKQQQWEQVLVFTKTKHGANRLTKFLCANNLPAAAIHGNKSQNARTKALGEFKQGDIKILVATDIAARGLDIDKLPQVVNFELPHVSEDYVHRIGRTGRAGEEGQAISLVCADEFKLLADIERLIKQVLPREEIDGFKPVNRLPESKLDLRPKKIKKPKKPKAVTSEQSQQDSPSNQTQTKRRRPQRGKRPASNSGNSGNGAKPTQRQSAPDQSKNDGARRNKPNQRRVTRQQSSKPATN